MSVSRSPLRSRRRGQSKFSAPLAVVTLRRSQRSASRAKPSGWRHVVGRHAGGRRGRTRTGRQSLEIVEEGAGDGLRHLAPGDRWARLVCTSTITMQRPPITSGRLHDADTEPSPTSAWVRVRRLPHPHARRFDARPSECVHGLDQGIEAPASITAEVTSERGSVVSTNRVHRRRSSTGRRPRRSRVPELAVGDEDRAQLARAVCRSLTATGRPRRRPDGPRPLSRLKSPRFGFRP